MLLSASVFCLLLLRVSLGVEGLCRRTGRSNCNCTGTAEGLVVHCINSKRENLELSAADIPKDLTKLDITYGKELRLNTNLFATSTRLEYVRIAFFDVVSVGQNSFANINSSKKKVSFVFEDGGNLILEVESWRNVSSPISVEIRRISTVQIYKEAFSFLQDLKISQVANVKLDEDAFSIEKPRTDAKFQVTSIVLNQVKLETLASNTFHSTVKQVIIRESKIGTVKGEAFNTVDVGHITIENTTIQKVEKTAFSDRINLQTLTLDNVTIHEVESGAFVSGATNLIIYRSSFETLHTGSFNVTVARATITSNNFKKVHSKAITLKQWDSLLITSNDFRKLETDAFISSQGEPKTNPLNITFRDNNLYNITLNAFDFQVNGKLNSMIENNTFINCQCGMSEYIEKLIKPYELSEKLLMTARCEIDHTLSKCVGRPEGFSSVLNFTNQITCPLRCEEVQRDAAIPPLSGVPSAIETIFENAVDQNRTIVGSVFIIVLCAMIVMMILPVFMWIGRHGYCSKARILLLPSTNSFINYLSRFFSGSGMTPTGSAHSISRLSIHEYAELQRKIGEAKEEEEIPLEDKATQTLPEELTQELLQSLQEKLNDPENYSEARNMIEHLYDLIKVEESCNKNYQDSTSINLDDLDRDNKNVYDVIVPKRKSSSREKKETVSTGTRAPSPDKLMPYMVYGETLKLQPPVCDYMDPKDHQVHTYTELPNRTPAGPNSIVCDYGEPTDTRVHSYTELPANIKMANRPLPSKPTDGGHSML